MKMTSSWITPQKKSFILNSLDHDVIVNVFPNKQLFYLCYMHVGNVTGCHAGCQEVSRCRTRGESREFIARKRQSTQARDPLWLWNPRETSPEVQNRGISGPSKRTHVLQKMYKKTVLIRPSSDSIQWLYSIYLITIPKVCPLIIKQSKQNRKSLSWLWPSLQWNDAQLWSIFAHLWYTISFCFYISHRIWPEHKYRRKR